ncbi:cilia- and flagella-associated protein 73 isoform X5 [Excalfactoria chinensis]|uniref:cilia- and flagella-associated protein 73 isoform X5 n=1 Tax=Excalfactoria chinensis TaxID=46218 RepID=UPI003B3A7CA6
MAAPRPAPPRAARAPDAAPETSPALEEQLSRAFQDKLRLQTVPTWDSASLLPSRRLLLKRREVVEVERALQAQREAMSARRQRARQRAAEERVRAARHRAEVSRLQQELERLQQHREQLGRRLRSLRVFADFLQDVQAATGQDVPSMLAQFEALVEVQEVLLQQVEAGRVAVAQSRAQLQQCCEEADSELSSSKEMLQLRARLEAAYSDVLKGESHWAQLQSEAAQKMLLLGQIRMAVLSLFQLAAMRLQVPKDVALEDTEAQLDVLLLCMQDLAAICAELGLHPHVPATTTTRPWHHRAVTAPPSQE